MNGYGLVAAIVQAIASLGWPVALVTIVWLFRQRLEDLLPALHAKYKDIEISFRLDQAEKEAAALPPPPATPSDVPKPTPEEISRFEQIATISPRAAILDLRRELEDTLRKLATATGIETRPMALRQLTRLLRSKDVIDQHTSALLEDLAVIGNAAAHSNEPLVITTDDALRYKKLADDLLFRLRVIEGAQASLVAAFTR